QYIHPQAWPEGLDCRGKRVVVIGSGATAVTLVPALAREGAHVTMLQRSPSYVFARPQVDSLAQGMQKWLPLPLAYHLTRWKNVLLGSFFYRRARSRPEEASRYLPPLAQPQLGPAVDLRHLTPDYKPRDQPALPGPDGSAF